MNVLIVGGNGQVGRELQCTVPAGVDLTTLTRAELDITREPEVWQAVTQIQPDAIINVAAYTAVDKAEQEPHVAFSVNTDGVAHLARAARHCRAYMIHVSTDFVFDGQQGTPYLPTHPPNPMGIYGISKWEGERHVHEILGETALILRTAWVYSAFGNNFVKTMVRLMRERDALRVVADQVGTPTWAQGLARALWDALAHSLTGVHHWTDAGVASWYDFAQAIQEESVHLGILPHAITLEPITTAHYPTPAPRPPFSVLDKTTAWQRLDETPLHWRVALRTMLRAWCQSP